jgi:hypothetical protein
MALIVARECLAIRIALEAASRSAESEIVRLCALWERRDPAKENIPTVIELIVDATVITWPAAFCLGQTNKLPRLRQ